MAPTAVQETPRPKIHHCRPQPSQTSRTKLCIFITAVRAITKQSETDGHSWWTKYAFRDADRYRRLPANATWPLLVVEARGARLGEDISEERPESIHQDGIPDSALSELVFEDSMREDRCTLDTIFEF